MLIDWILEKLFLGLCIAIAAASVLLIGWAIYLLAQPGCEERGGRLVEDGIFWMPLTIGRVVILQPQTNYTCVGASK